MIRYLLFDTVASADARSRAAWTPGEGDTITVRQWDILPLQADGQAALLIPDGTDAELSEAERAQLLESLPGASSESS